MSSNAHTYNTEATARMWESFNQHDHAGIIRALDEGADPDALEGTSSILGFIVSIVQGYSTEAKLSVIRKLAEKGCNLNGKYGHLVQTTALSRAAKSCNTEITELLLALGADPKICDSDGKTPLFHARTPETVFMLLNAGATVSGKDKYGDTIPAYWARAHEKQFGAFLAYLFLPASWQGQEKEGIALWESIVNAMPPHMQACWADYVDLTPLRRNMRPASADSAVRRYLTSQASGLGRGGSA